LMLVMKIVLSRFGGVQLKRAGLLTAFSAGSGAPFSVAAAGACWDVSPEEAQRLLRMLAEAALIQPMPGDLYSLHPALFDPLRAQVEQHELAQAATRLRDHYLALVEMASGARQQIDAEIGQIMAAYRHASKADPVLASLFADALLSYFEQSGLWGSLVRLTTETVNQAFEDGDVMREHQYLNDLGFALTMLGDLKEARRHFERSLRISQSLSDPSSEAAALNNIGALLEREGRYGDAEEYYRRSLSLRETMGIREDIVETLNNVAGVLYRQKRWDDALSSFQRVFDLFSELGDRRGQAQTWLNIGTIYEAQGRDPEALEAYQRSFATFSNQSDEAGQAQALNNIGVHYFNQGDMERALICFRRSLTLKERLTDRPGPASTLNNIALLHERTGSLQLALDHYQRSYRILHALGDPRAEVVQDNIENLRRKM
ncbi:MAG: tetratricopeptide repeat protein, partial [Anaerolineae bacterium]|nr:tetratricopeptide repeat protein [Anaerolineae bacterium]